METNLLAFGELLRKHRRQSGLTQRDLARRVGVDFSYISKLENDRLPAPAIKTIRRLTEAIGAPPEELLAAANKSPDDFVKGSATKQSNRREYSLPPHLDVLAFGMDLDSDRQSPDSYYMQLLHGLQAEANRSAGAKVNLRSCLQPRFDVDTLDEISQRDGLILTGRLDLYMDGVEQAISTNLPLVLANRRIGGKTLNCVLSDYYPACQELVDYLYGKGFRRFGWLGRVEKAPHYDYRLDMIRGRLASKGMQILPRDCHFLEQISPDAVLQTMAQWIALGDLPEVLICSNGSLTPHVQRAMATAGLTCPDDLSLACFDNTDFVRYCHPEPTRMATYPAEIGRRAYRRLIEILSEESERSAPETILVPTRLIEGGSVRPPR
ncbi:MAG: substrate-binding domain-containing protein [Phycisphaerae bacterium]|nr:substrate-binding domain-containing protein [Phycisphaerae bacterium]